MSTPASEKAVHLEQRLNALVSGGAILPFFAVKASDTSRGSTSLSDDPELAFTVPTPAMYAITGHLLYSGGTGTSQGDLRVSMSPSAGSLRWAVHRKNPSAVWVVSDKLISGDTSVSMTNGITNDNTLRFFGIWQVTSASPSSTIALRWCKDVTADGSTDTHLRPLSWMMLTLMTLNP